MAKVFDSLDDDLVSWIERQHVFFVASAPVDGHVNLSPKGYDTFRVLDPRRVAYLDLTGSGVETVSHLRENGRLTIMFVALDGPPQIVRLYGRGEVHPAGSERFDALAPLFPELPGRRAVIEAHLSRISTSCGYSIPRFSFEAERDTLNATMRRKSAEQLNEYHGERNSASIDGLPGLPTRTGR
jgi:Pyridoxamine 5'-phosphate oxidase